MNKQEACLRPATRNAYVHCSLTLFPYFLGILATIFIGFARRTFAIAFILS